MVVPASTCSCSAPIGASASWSPWGRPVPVGSLYAGTGRFSEDLKGLPPYSDAVLLASVVPTQSSLTHTWTPEGNGRRMGVDRDLDGFLDGDELLAGSNPAGPTAGSHRGGSGQ